MLVNHEKKFPVDSTCSNLAIKYNMIYISAYQLIRDNIQKKTDYGKKLLETMKHRELNADMKVNDEFEEETYCSVHFDDILVKELINKTIAEKRTNQKFVILEGLCNSKKLANVDDQMVYRFMDELFAIEHYIGDVKGIISLQSEAERNFILDEEIQYEKFPEPPPPVVKEKKYDEEGNEIIDEEENAEEQPLDDDDKPKVEPFKKEKYQWTVRNRKPFNLPQLYSKCKGVLTYSDVKEATDFGSTIQGSIAKSLDNFCGRLLDSENSDKYIYQQIIFK